MIKVENIEVFNFEGAIRGMRNPLNSWDRSDSDYECYDIEYGNGIGEYLIGENDLSLMHKLYKAGTEHRKYLRQIFVSMDITAPLYWWKENETYKVGTVSNSCSTMHKIHAKEFTLDDFSFEHLLCADGNDYIKWGDRVPIATLEIVIQTLNQNRDMYIKTKDKKYWWQMIQLLPSSYNQKRTITMNYENVMSIINQRTGHKLDEWNDFVKVLKNLPYVEAIREGIVK